MALKTIRVIARRTIYFYLDVEANSKSEAIGMAQKIPEQAFTKKDFREEWKIIGAAIMTKGEEVDDLKCLSPRTIIKQTT